MSNGGVIVIDFSKIFEDFEKEGNVKLNKTGDISDFDMPEIQAILTYLYDHPDSQMKKFGTLLNSIFYHQRQIFLLSRRIFGNLIVDDRNINISSINSETWAEFLRKCVQGGYLERLREPTKNKAGIYKLIREEFVDILHKYHNREYFDAQEKAALKFYDEESEVDKELDKRLEEAKKKVKAKKAVNQGIFE